MTKQQKETVRISMLGNSGFKELQGTRSGQRNKLKIQIAGPLKWQTTLKIVFVGNVLSLNILPS